LELNDTEILVCPDDYNLSTTNHGAMIQEVLVSCKAYDVEMKARKLSSLG
jgi:hypothetical protein